MGRVVQLAAAVAAAAAAPGRAGPDHTRQLVAALVDVASLLVHVHPLGHHHPAVGEPHAAAAGARHELRRRLLVQPRCTMRQAAEHVLRRRLRGAEEVLERQVVAAVVLHPQKRRGRQLEVIAGDAALIGRRCCGGGGRGRRPGIGIGDAHVRRRRC